eukprot:CAMPEP_0180181408 /NCGR_PEP_ID=MMETSP0986-20121125/40108_1 /TAXON_ID=697907 /ORGANISM="non described non described, Strain CCMP2293" /LENGTH=157 /DNA_ID=CAMNT_0022134691 /DNA_START=27 /DNA_END=501 /DNA_ORIENTATION=+
MIQYGISGSGLHSAKLRDLDAGAPRAPLPTRALPDDVRRKLGLGPRGGAERPPRPVESVAPLAELRRNADNARAARNGGMREDAPRIPRETAQRLGQIAPAPRRASMGVGNPATRRRKKLQRGKGGIAGGQDSCEPAVAVCDAAQDNARAGLTMSPQ